MKKKTARNTSADIAFGAFAGILGGLALGGAAQTIYSLTNPKTIAEEKAIEPKDPFIVLAEKLGKATGKDLNERQKKLFETSVATAISATAGMSYSLLAKKWKLNWLQGGLVFGGIFWAVEDEGMSFFSGLAGDNTKYPLEAHLRGLAAHVVFGIVTAGLLQAFQSDNKAEETY